MAGQRPSLSVLSGFTLVFAVAVTGAAALMSTLISLEILGAEASIMLGLIGQPAALSAAAVVTLVMALLMESAPRRRAWLIMGAGLLLTALGEAVGAYHWLVLGKQVSYPGPGEVLYAAGYVMMATAMIAAALVYRGRDSISWPFAEAAGLTSALGIVVWVVAAMPGAYRWPLDGQQVTNLVYVMSDLLFLFGPAIFLVLAAMRLSDYALIVPASLILVGVSLITAGDVLGLVETNLLGWQPGSMSDFCAMVGPAFIAVAASSVIDIQRAALRANRRAA